MKHKKILFLPLLFFAVLFAIVLIKKKLDDIVVLTYAAGGSPESNDYLDNPYEGFYQIFGYVLKDDVSYASPEEVPHLPDPDEEERERLVQIQINLRNYAQRPISDSALRQLDTILNAWSNTRRSLILRFLYDWDGRATEAEPDSIEQIMVHMEQTAAIYNRYADSIFVIQGLSTGNTGEMNNSNYGSAESMSRLAQKLAEVTAPPIFLSVRTPSQWRSITGADCYSELVSMPHSPFPGRLGLYNDGMLGSSSDTGTYVERSREEELAFQDELCRLVPNGGEVIIDNSYNDLDNAIRDMRTMHITYLNSGHDAAVIDKWQRSSYHGADVFDGFSGLEYIRNHLGYRYVLRSSAVQKSSAGRGSSLFITIENAGFSASPRRFSFTLTLWNPETDERFVLLPDFDSSALPGNETTVLELPIDGHAYPPATYELYWQTMNPVSGEIIRYGNKMEPTEHGYRLGSLTIEAPYRRTEQ